MGNTYRYHAFSLVDVRRFPFLQANNKASLRHEFYLTKTIFFDIISLWETLTKNVLRYMVMDDKLTLQNGTAFMDKCLDAALNEQRSMAHGAIDMDDWGKAQEILAIAKRNISLVEDLRVKFAAFKESVRAAEDIIGGEDAPKDTNVGGDKTPDETPAADPDEANEEFLVQLEELIADFPFAMAVCNEAAGIGEHFTYDEAEVRNMKKPAKLSNSLWVDTAVSKSKADELVEQLREYCKNRG